MSDNKEIIRYETIDDCILKIIMPNNISQLASALYGINLQFDIAHMCPTKEELETACRVLKGDKL